MSDTVRNTPPARPATVTEATVSYTRDDVMVAFEEGLTMAEKTRIGMAPGYAEGFLDGHAARVTVPSRCFNTDPHLPHRTTFAPAVGIENFDCPGIDGPASQACPAWCNGEHVGEDVSDIRECRSDEAYVPDFKGRARGVGAVRIFDRVHSHVMRGEGVVAVEDLEFTPKQARVLARALVEVADLIDG